MTENEEIVKEIVNLSSLMLGKIEELTERNAALEKKCLVMENTIETFISMQGDLVKTIKKMQQESLLMGKTMTRSVNNVAYEMGGGTIPIPRIVSAEDTVKKIISEKASVARFGDGEFSIMMGKSRQGFQKQDDKLAEKLKTVINCDTNGFLVAIADNYSDLSKYSESAQNEIRYYMTEEVRKGHNQYLSQDRTYYNAYITTPYMLYSDKETENPEKRFREIKCMWENRNVIIVEGELSRLGVNNDLFDSAKSIKRILGPAEHAFDKYEELLTTAERVGNSVDEALFLISLGPTATVLSFDLFSKGFQAIDIGHIDNDYEFFLRGAKERIAIPGKYVNNVTRKEEIVEENNLKYLESIICKII